MRPRRLHAVVLLLLTVITGSTWAQTPGQNNAITDVPGISVGHFTGADAGTTVVLGASPTGQGVAGGVTQRGGSPGTRETDLMRPDNLVEAMNAIVLSGGSVYGIAAASGVMRCLEDRRRRLPRRRRQRRPDRADGRLVRSRDLQRAARLAARTSRRGSRRASRRAAARSRRAMSAPAPAPCPAASRVASARRASCCRTASSSARSSR